MHVQHVLLGALVVNDLRPLHDAIRPKITRTLPAQQRAFVFPFDEVGGGVAIYILECRAVRLVFTDPAIAFRYLFRRGARILPVIDAPNFDHAAAMCLDMLSRIGLQLVRSGTT